MTVEICSWDFRISTDRDLKHHKMRHTLEMVSIARIVSHLLVSKNRSQKLIKPFVSETTESACICIRLYLPVFCICKCVCITDLIDIIIFMIMAIPHKLMKDNFHNIHLKHYYCHKPVMFCLWSQISISFLFFIT